MNLFFDILPSISGDGMQKEGGKYTVRKKSDCDITSSIIILRKYYTHQQASALAEQIPTLGQFVSSSNTQ